MPSLPALPADDSMLTRRFGREVANYFAGSPLNRLSFLRTDHAFLTAAFAHPSTSFLLLESLKPLTSDPATLAYVKRTDVVPLTGDDPLRKPEADLIRDFNSDEPHPLIVFLGIDEGKREPGGFAYRDYGGTPYFAVDVTPSGPLADAAKGIVDAVQARGLVFQAARMHVTLSPGEGKSKLANRCRLPARPTG